MGLFSFLKRDKAAPAAKPVADSADAVQVLRLRARRRLIGAAVLVGIGVIGFPLLFETQPRPIPVDLPIEIPRKEGAVPLTIPAPLNNAAVAVADSPAAASTVATSVPTAPEKAPKADKAEQFERPERVEAPPEKPRQVIEKPVEKPVERAAEKHADKPAAKLAEKPVEKAAEKRIEAKAGGQQESARVQALLDGRAQDRKPEAKAADGGGRFIVQVGAYADAKAAQEARMKVERLGLKTYTQAVETADGKRIRVRVGPFGSRDEADKVAAKVRGGGLSTAVLTL